MRIYRTKIVAIIPGLILSGCIFISCHKKPASWDTQILAPVVNANLSINNIITSSYIKNNAADSSVSLVYTDSLYALNLDTLLNIPDTVLVYDTSTPITYTFNPGDVMFSAGPTTTTYPLGSVQLVEGILQSGYLVYTLANPLGQPVDYFYELNNITTNNGAETLEIIKEVNANTTVKDSISLSGYTINFRGPNNNGYNDITSSIRVNLDSNASSLTVTGGDKLVDAHITFKRVIPYYAKGYFGTTTKTFGPENVKFPVFSKIVAGSLNLQNVNVNLTINNGFGVDASLVLSKLTSNRGIDTIPLTDNAVVGSTIHINRATPTNNVAPASPVNPSVSNFSITPSNSNILQWLDNMPTSIGYKLQVITDPLGNVSGFNDFAYYGYGINANINVTIPLSLIANNLTLADTLAVNFAGSGTTTQHVKSGKLTLYASNGFPFSAGLQLYLLNKNNMVYDSLFIPAQTIASGIVNAITGIVTSPQSSVLTISLDEAHTQELLNTKNMIMYARFNMGNLPSTYRKIYDYYQLGVKLVANFDYQIN